MSNTELIGQANYFRIAWFAASAACAAISRTITYPFRNVRAPTLRKDILNAVVRCMLEHLTVADSRYLKAQTSESYALHCKARNLEPKTLKVNNSDGEAVAHWIGDPDAEKVILYFHGGGYTQPASEGNFRYLSRFVKDLNSDEVNPSVSVLMLAYTLVPEAVHPAQLREAAVVLAYLVNDTGRSPKQLFIAGDSAGGGLALSVLSHILHPHPDVFAVKLQCPLGGALLLSPWVGFNTEYPSFTINATLDMVSPVAPRKWAAMYMNKANKSNAEADPGPISGDPWTEACLNASSWWNGMHQVVGDVFVWRGSYEVFVDSIRMLEQSFKAGWADGGGNLSRTIFLESAKEAHVAPIVDVMALGAKKGDAQVAIEEWFKGRLQQ